MDGTPFHQKKLNFRLAFLALPTHHAQHRPARAAYDISPRPSPTASPGQQASPVVHLWSVASLDGMCIRAVKGCVMEQYDDTAFWISGITINLRRPVPAPCLCGGVMSLSLRNKTTFPPIQPTTSFKCRQYGTAPCQNQDTNQ